MRVRGKIEKGERKWVGGRRLGKAPARKKARLPQSSVRINKQAEEG